MIRLLSSALIVVAACALPAVDQLDPDQVNDIANDPGDAVGTAYTGNYDVTATPLECDCPLLVAEDFPGGGAGVGLEPGQSVDPCFELDAFYGRPVDAGGIIELEQNGGLSSWINWVPVMTGPVNQDGSFIVAGFEDFSETFIRAQIVSRVDGLHVNDDTFSGILRQRVIAELPGQNIDCRSSHQIDGRRLDDAAN